MSFCVGFEFWVSNEERINININLGRIQNFKEGGSILGPPKAVLCRGIRGHPPPENFEIQVLGNAISDVLRPSHGVLRSCFFQAKMSLFCIKILQNYAKIIKIMYSYSNLHLRRTIELRRQVKKAINFSH